MPLVPPTPTSTEYPTNKDQVEGRVNRAAGKAQSTLGDIKNHVKSDTKKSSR